MNKKDLLLSGQAASAVLIPQALTAAFPSLLPASAAPAARLGYCSGSCAACGGFCLTGISAVLWLGTHIYKKHYCRITAKI